MKLQGRKLKINMRGEDVAMLHQALQSLGFEIPESEVQQQRFGRETRVAVLEFQRGHNLEPTGVVDEQTARLLGSFFVRGTVRYADDQPSAGVTVRAFDRDLRREQQLGYKTETDTNGRYRIAYTAQEFSRAEKRSADLVVRVYGPDETVLGESEVIFNAADVETVDLVVADPRSEYERLAEAIGPLLAGQGIRLSDLTEDETYQDFTFLAGETGEERHHIELFVVAEKLSLEAEGETTSSSRKRSKPRFLAPEIFYGLVRQNLPTTLKALLEQRQPILKRALETARRSKFIPASLTNDELDAALGKLRELTLN